MMQAAGADFATPQKPIGGQQIMISESMIRLIRHDFEDELQAKIDMRNFSERCGQDRHIVYCYDTEILGIKRDISLLNSILEEDKDHNKLSQEDNTNV